MHIADVSHYVREGSKLDERSVHPRDVGLLSRPCGSDAAGAAVERHLQLEPGCGSSRPKCYIDVTPLGDVVGSRFADGVIRSAARMTYTKVRQILVDEDDDLAPRVRAPSSLTSRRCWRSTSILRARREARGSIDFDRPDAEVVLGRGRASVVDIRAARSATSPTASSKSSCSSPTRPLPDGLRRAERHPSIYRVHEEPDEDRVEQFEDFILGSGIPPARSPRKRLHPKAFRSSLRRIEGKPEEHLLSYRDAACDETGRSTPRRTTATTRSLRRSTPISRHPSGVIRISSCTAFFASFGIRGASTSTSTL